ncbi:proteasome subunit alpha [Micrococcales bacterium 31B]|nr:proteasome subunit alpha [Micrococcales bacterium 31B]
MSTPFYVSPEQLMKDRADFARKGIARGRSVIVMSCAAGVVFVAENTSATLHKVSEIYDSIGFAAVGKYNEFESLRVAGIRYADMRGYSYDHTDVTARGLANAYAQTLGTVFTTEQKPFEIEITVAELGAEQTGDQLYRLFYDGSVADEHDFVVMGGQTEPIIAAMRAGYRADLDLAAAVSLGVSSLGSSAGKAINPAHLEVALLDRTLKSTGERSRAFRRIGDAACAGLLAGTSLASH